MKNTPLIGLCILFLQAACSGQATPTLYSPPTSETSSIVSSQTPPPVIGSGVETPTLQPSPTPACSPGLTYLEDVTIPDGTLVAQGEILDKRWLVENTGSCNWDDRFSLRLIAGSGMTENPEYALYPARSGTRADLRILFTAPQELGVHRSAWQAFDPQGEIFGDPIFIEVVVENPEE
ncbi:MAG: NBR1-Ig-like domain-containing protein [Anaerolineales bacterium]